MSRVKRDLAAADHVFLAFLLDGERSAYDIKKAMASSVSYFWHAAHSQVYQQAARLARDGYIRERPAAGARRRKLLALTARGRAAVSEWLRAPAPPVRIYSEALVKLFFAPQAGDFAATLSMLENARRDGAVRLESFERLRTEIGRVDELRYPTMTLHMGIATLRAELAWLDEVIAAVSRDAARGRPRPAPKR